MTDRNLDTNCIAGGHLEGMPDFGTVNPIFPATTYRYLDQDQNVYPRYFNTPNQQLLNNRIAMLEKAEAALTFGSGMAAISTSLLAFLEPGDHAVIQNSIYGGTSNFINRFFDRYGIEFTITTGREVEDFANEIRPNTRLLYLETPSNPLLAITDIQAVATIAKEKGLLTFIDNTFASPVNQNPHRFGIDLVLHSATKYLGGHSDICAGFAVGTREHIDHIRQFAKCLGGSLNAQTCYLLERSIKTLGLRVGRHNENALAIARFLRAHPLMEQVHYPGLEGHAGYQIAREQMSGFGGMVSFELRAGIDPHAFQQRLQVITPALSLGGVESTICSPMLSSHAAISPEERHSQGISDGLLRLSVGLESLPDLIRDIEQALEN